MHALLGRPISPKNFAIYHTQVAVPYKCATGSNDNYNKLYDANGKRVGAFSYNINFFRYIHKDIDFEIYQYQY